MTHYLEKALAIAIKAHEGQVDKNGQPYILHPIAVASRLDDLELKTIAILHDTIEDTDITLDFLLKQGIPEEVVDIVKILTKPKNVKYEDYLREICKNPKAKQVKIADLAHNTDSKRTDGLNEHRKAKYELAKKILLS